MADTQVQTADGVATADAAILAAWEMRKAAYAAIDAMPEAKRSESGRLSPDEKLLWAGIEHAENLIAGTTATGAEAIEAKLWTGLYHTIGEPVAHEGQALLRGDLEALDAMGDALDLHVRSILSAIRSLWDMGGRNGH